VAVKGRLVGGSVAAVLTLATGIVASFEGYVPHTYSDPVGISTACYGHTGPDVMPNRIYTQSECDALLSGDLSEAYEAVKECIKVPLTPNQAAALTSAAFNAGPKIVCGSTLMRMANAGEPPSEWCPQLKRWVYARGVKLPGLVKRRDAETKLCLSY